MKTMWDGMSEELKADYGEDFIRKVKGFMKNFRRKGVSCSLYTRLFVLLKIDAHSLAKMLSHEFLYGLFCMHVLVFHLFCHKWTMARPHGLGEALLVAD